MIIKADMVILYWLLYLHIQAIEWFDWIINNF